MFRNLQIKIIFLSATLLSVLLGVANLASGTWWRIQSIFFGWTVLPRFGLVLAVAIPALGVLFSLLAAARYPRIRRAYSLCYALLLFQGLCGLFVTVAYSRLVSDNPTGDVYFPAFKGIPVKLRVNPDLALGGTKHQVKGTKLGLHLNAEVLNLLGVTIGMVLIGLRRPLFRAGTDELMPRFATNDLSAGSGLKSRISFGSTVLIAFGVCLALPLALMTESVKPKEGWHGWPADAPAPLVAESTPAEITNHQDAWARYLGIDGEFTNTIGMKFRLIPPCEFLMGGAPRKVILTKPFYIGVHEVRQKDWQTVMGDNRSSFRPNGLERKFVEKVAGLDTGDHPVEGVSSRAALSFCNVLSEMEKTKAPTDHDEALARRDTNAASDKRPHTVFHDIYSREDGYRLPTEAEWEFVCSAGAIELPIDTEAVLTAGWFETNSGGRTHAVGELKANSFGVHDILGNVFEWCHDIGDPNIKGPFPKPLVDPCGKSYGLRGGSWNFPADLLPASVSPQKDYLPGEGFRIVRMIDCSRVRSFRRRGN